MVWHDLKLAAEHLVTRASATEDEGVREKLSQLAGALVVLAHDYDAMVVGLPDATFTPLGVSIVEEELRHPLISQHSPEAQLGRRADVLFKLLLNRYFEPEVRDVEISRLFAAGAEDAIPEAVWAQFIPLVTSTGFEVATGDEVRPWFARMWPEHSQRFARVRLPRLPGSFLRQVITPEKVDRSRRFVFPSGDSAEWKVFLFPQLNFETLRQAWHSYQTWLQEELLRPAG
jgi:hypothetical protein